MKPIKWKSGCNNIPESLDIPQKRIDELEYRLQLICHEMNKPVRKDEESPTSDTFIKMCVALAENEQELVFCAFVAGTQVENIFDIIIPDEEEEDF
jgi:hypothetical protein